MTFALILLGLALAFVFYSRRKNKKAWKQEERKWDIAMDYKSHLGHVKYKSPEAMKNHYEIMARIEKRKKENNK